MLDIPPYVAFSDNIINIMSGVVAGARTDSVGWKLWWWLYCCEYDSWKNFLGVLQRKQHDFGIVFTYGMEMMEEKEHFQKLCPNLCLPVPQTVK